MRSFLKMFLASFLALFIFCLVTLFFFIGWISSLSPSSKEKAGSKAALVLDHIPIRGWSIIPLPILVLPINMIFRSVHLVRSFTKQQKIAQLKAFTLNVMLTQTASRKWRDPQCHRAFPKSGRFVYAYGDVIGQRFMWARLPIRYCNPKGGVDWEVLPFSLRFWKRILISWRSNHKYFMQANSKVQRNLFEERWLSQTAFKQERSWRYLWTFPCKRSARLENWYSRIEKIRRQQQHSICK